MAVESTHLEDGEQTKLPVESLEPHPRNQEIYTNGDISDVASRMEEHGFKEEHRILVTTNRQILSGHRRWRSAKKVGIERVPVEVVEVEDDEEALFRLLLANEYRDKTAAEKINEAQAWREYYESDKSAELRTNKKYDQKAAQKVDIGERSIEKGRKVKEIATGERKAPDRVVEVAKEQWEAMKKDGEEGQTINAAYTEIQEIENQVEVEKKESEEAKHKRKLRRYKFNNSSEKVTIKHGEFQSTDIEDESVDHIITDPPYGEDALNVWADLSEFANRVLKPGGFCIAYTGKYHLPDVISGLSKELTYYWQMVLHHKGGGAKFFARKMRTNYKPVLVFAKAPVEKQEDFITDVIEGDGREKDDHEWQQAEGEAASLIERFTDINDRICDPMCGSGTVGVAAERLERKVVLIDRDEEAVNTARGKISDES